MLPLFDINQTISTVALVLPSAKYFVPPLWCQEISLFLLLQVSRDTFLGLAVTVTQVHITLFMFYYLDFYLLSFLIFFFTLIIQINLIYIAPFRINKHIKVLSVVS